MPGNRDRYSCFRPLRAFFGRPIEDDLRSQLGPSSFGTKTKTPVNFYGHDDKGFAPLGVKSLLDSTNMNVRDLWLASLQFFENGVLVPRGTFTPANIQDKINRLERMYPVSFGTKAFGVFVHEGLVMRGLHILGDDECLANFWAGLSDGSIHARGFNSFDKALLWTAMVPNTVFVPYLDFDEKSQNSEDLDRLLTCRVMPAVDLIHGAVCKAAGKTVPWQMFFNKRTLSSGLIKFSFHVHFYEAGVENISVFKLLIANMADLPRKLNWEESDGVWKFSEDSKPIVDTAVYGGRNQLFRGPFCGKTDDTRSVLLPVHVERKGSTCVLVDEEYEGRRPEFILRARIARSRVGLSMCDFGDHVPPHLAPSRSSSGIASAINNTDDNKYLYEFFRPLLISSIIPAWQLFRNRVLTETTMQCGATVPIECPGQSLRIVKNDPHARRVGVRHLVVEGDTFCFMDANHVHTRSRRAIGIVVDLIHCTIQQSCFACGNPSGVYHFLHNNNDIRIEPESRSKFSCLWHFQPESNGSQFFLNYYSDLFRFHRITQMVWVYDEDCRIWKTGQGGNRVAGLLVDRLNRTYNSYINAKKQVTVAGQISAYEEQNARDGRVLSQDQVEVFAMKIYEDARKFVEEHMNILRISATNRGKLLEDLKQYSVRFEINEFNPFSFLLPMKNGQCVNLFTLETEDIRPNHYFTGLLNAELTTEVKDIDHWFWEVSTGCEDKARFLKMIGGYMMTMSVHDRKLYVLKGTGKNGKGLFKQFLVDVMEGPPGSESRWKAVQPAFWRMTVTNAENASPHMYGLLHRSLVYTDDMDRVPIDACHVKRIVAGEPVSCRNLYGSAVQFRTTVKILWTTNFFPDAPGNDAAFWERFVVIPFLTKYTPDEERVDEAKFIFPMNEVNYRNLLEKGDAFFTVCVRALHNFYRSLPCNPETHEPVVLSSFPCPASIETAIREARETQLPLASFIREYTEKTDIGMFWVRIDTLFHNYILFLENINERKLKQETTQSSFIRLLNSALEIGTTPTHVQVKLIKSVVETKTAMPWTSGDAII